jgi:hypothetical protein
LVFEQDEGGYAEDGGERDERKTDGRAHGS